MDQLSENDTFPPYISLTDRANLSNIQEKLVISATVRKGSIVAYHDLHLNVRFQYKADIRFDCFNVCFPAKADIQIYPLNTIILMSTVKICIPMAQRALLSRVGFQGVFT